MGFIRGVRCAALADGSVLFKGDALLEGSYSKIREGTTARALMGAKRLVAGRMSQLSHRRLILMSFLRHACRWCVDQMAGRIANMAWSVEGNTGHSGGLRGTIR